MELTKFKWFIIVFVIALCSSIAKAADRESVIRNYLFDSLKATQSESLRFDILEVHSNEIKNLLTQLKLNQDSTQSYLEIVSEFISQIENKNMFGWGSETVVFIERMNYWSHMKKRDISSFFSLISEVNLDIWTEDVYFKIVSGSSDPVCSDFLELLNAEVEKRSLVCDLPSLENSNFVKPVFITISPSSVKHDLDGINLTFNQSMFNRGIEKNYIKTDLNSDKKEDYALVTSSYSPTCISHLFDGGSKKTFIFPEEKYTKKLPLFDIAEEYERVSSDLSRVKNDIITVYSDNEKYSVSGQIFQHNGKLYVWNGSELRFYSKKDKINKVNLSVATFGKLAKKDICYYSTKK